MFDVLAAVFLLVGIVLFTVDRRTRTSTEPVKPQGNVLRNYALVLRDPWVRTVVLTVFLEGGLFYGAFAYAGAYLKERFALSYLIIGGMLAGFGVGGIIYSFSVKWLLARLGEKGFVRLGGALMFACMAIFAALPWWQATIPIFIVAGFGFYMFHNTLQTRATEMAPQMRGTAIAVFAFFLFMGQAGGVAFCGQIIRWLHYEWTFALTGALLATLGLWFAFRIEAHRAEVQSRAA